MSLMSDKIPSQLKDYQPQYQDILMKIRLMFKRALGLRLHSLYVFGSVANQKVIPHISDLNLVVITSQKPDLLEISNLRKLLQMECRIFHSIDIRVASRTEVVSIDGIFKWGFLLRNLAHCIEGDDLGRCFGKFEPSWEISKQWAGNINQQLHQFSAQLDNAKDESKLKYVQYRLSQKMLRWSYGLVMHRTQLWVDNPLLVAPHFLKYYPEQKNNILKLLMLHQRNRVISKAVTAILAAEYGAWLQDQYAQIEFRIG